MMHVLWYYDIAREKSCHRCQVFNSENFEFGGIQLFSGVEGGMVTR